MLKEIDAQSLSPNIRNAVLWLRRHGFDTTDSGDGSNFKQGMEGACPFPMVSIKVHKDKLLSECDRLEKLLMFEGIQTRLTEEYPDAVQIQGTYDPADCSCVILISEFGGRGFLARLGETS